LWAKKSQWSIKIFGAAELFFSPLGCSEAFSRFPELALQRWRFQQIFAVDPAGFGNPFHLAQCFLAGVAFRHR
jgi:hypothetical protein